MSETVIRIEGMKCMHCKMAVEKALKGVSGVVSVQVDMDKGQAVVIGSAEQAVMVKAIDEAGYKVTG